MKIEKTKAQPRAIFYRKLVTFIQKFWVSQRERERVCLGSTPLLFITTNKFVISASNLIETFLLLLQWLVYLAPVIQSFSFWLSLLWFIDMEFRWKSRKLLRIISANFASSLNHTSAMQNFGSTYALLFHYNNFWIFENIVHWVTCWCAYTVNVKL